MKFIYDSRGESVKNLNYDFIHIDELVVPCQSNAKREKSFPTFFLTDISISGISFHLICFALIFNNF